MTEKIKFKAANPPRIMKYDHFAHSAVCVLQCSAMHTATPTAMLKSSTSFLNFTPEQFCNG